ncbi:MAG: HDIG domain-containing protein [Deltaproteobacteria bacterium]|jgi:putative nucleotidyltransferase with HDIG domain|nr:HDIG domain-containing protein [Deltaproteobacteria bacterium]
MNQENRDAQGRPVRDRALPFVKAFFPAARAFSVPDKEAGDIPDREACAALWDKYAMPAHIRAHSRQVAMIVEHLEGFVRAAGIRLDPALLMAGALLHDIAKAYTISFGGNHAQLGAAWMAREGISPRAAQMILHHVHWPWQLDIRNESMLPSLILVYADKRVLHDAVVGLEERFKDLTRRYGHTERIRMFIASSMAQGRDLEHLLSELSGVRLDEYSFDCGRLV